MENPDRELPAADLLIDLREDGDSLHLPIWAVDREDSRRIPMAFSELDIPFLVNSDMDGVLAFVAGAHVRMPFRVCKDGLHCKPSWRGQLRLSADHTDQRSRVSE